MLRKGYIEPADAYSELTDEDTGAGHNGGQSGTVWPLSNIVDMVRAYRKTYYSMQ